MRSLRLEPATYKAARGRPDLPIFHPMANPQAVPVKLHLEPTLGVSYIAIIFSTMLYGLTCLQTFIYFVSAPRDPWIVKALVIATLVIDSIHEAFLIHAGYYYFILEFDNTVALQRVVWSLLATVFCNGVTGLLVESFILWRVYHMSGRNVYLCIVIGIFILAHIGTNFAFAIQGLDDPLFTKVQRQTGSAVSELVFGAVADVGLAVSLAYYLYIGRSGRKSSDTVVNKLILYTVTTGLVPSINDILTLIVHLALPKAFYDQFFNFLVCELYTNTFLATLNVRASVRALAQSSSAFESINIATVGIDRAPRWKPIRKTRHSGTAALPTYAVSVTQVQNAESEVELKVPNAAVHTRHGLSFMSATDSDA
ncbi:hypothetical protein FA95DRAFT_1681047 [Auriscalpium vulgare]|uniref:Uncharacterized protein n=1 Tax=Auriscalpium vulgare TaxID=40419 RepID=A0ACB8RKR6_9AGAM|nr:hypothetical protein FA95DRAFT_1681047 [Auriscalpium vulgare]